ncbi:hypothetical protein K9N68_20505 [Kovacikia minuta CCNUW1]|uniref:hypothetical protein n=1 Tax=Kovacikia minuta TaxID=2931930 RepID=UPI001CCEFEB6|nr:hypothetical protein [Kovacikia minuta]UBF24095.1 hypothetical protein K9N68_20505 [Kovacikia minuta CCNUW1]
MQTSTDNTNLFSEISESESSQINGGYHGHGHHHGHHGHWRRPWHHRRHCYWRHHRRHCYYPY